jgi:hypothetical protein
LNGNLHRDTGARGHPVGLCEWITVGGQVNPQATTAPPTMPIASPIAQ